MSFQCDTCIHSKNNVCMVDDFMGVTEYEHCYDYGDRRLYEKGKRDGAVEFAHWIINRIHTRSIQRVLSEIDHFNGIEDLVHTYEEETKEGIVHHGED